MIRDGIILVLDARSSSAEFKLLELGDDNALDPRVNGQIEGIETGYVRPPYPCAP